MTKLATAYLNNYCLNKYLITLQANAIMRVYNLIFAILKCYMAGLGARHRGIIISTIMFRYLYLLKA